MTNVIQIATCMCIYLARSLGLIQSVRLLYHVLYEKLQPISTYERLILAYQDRISFTISPHPLSPAVPESRYIDTDIALSIHLSGKYGLDGTLLGTA